MKRKITNIITNFLLIISTLVCLFAIAQKTIFKDSSVFGYKVYVIVTSSMQPELYVGDVILVNDNISDIHVGDNITYLGAAGTYKDKVVTHKVASINWSNGERTFITKGIQNTAFDPEVKDKNVYGKMVYKFFLISAISKIIRSKIGFFIIVVIPLVALLLKELLNLKKMLKNNKKNDII